MRIALFAALAPAALRSPPHTDHHDDSCVAPLACQLANRGHSVDVIASSDIEFAPNALRAMPNLRLLRVDLPACHADSVLGIESFLTTASRLIADRMALEHCDYDVMHGQCVLSGRVSEHLARARGMPHVVTVDTLAPASRTSCFGDSGVARWKRWSEALLVEGATRAIATSPQCLSEMVAIHGADVRRTDIVPHGYDPHEAYCIDKRIARAILGWDANDCIILQRSDDSTQGIATAIRSLAVAQARHRLPLRLQIIHAGSQSASLALPEITRLRQLATTLGVGAAVRFMDAWPRDVLSIFRSAADVFITLSERSGFASGALEAMACGLPVVASRRASTAYIVQHGATGRVLPSVDPDSLAESLAALCTDRTLRQSMGIAGRRRAENFTWYHVAKALSRVYENAIAASHAAAAGGCSAPAQNWHSQRVNL